ncbi:MAG TPA: Gfo/Idh/MocA family oxidoreductase [Limnochordia bacterium]
MSGEIGFGIVGLGMGMARAQHVLATPGARLVAVADLNPERRQRAAERFGCRTYPDHRALIADGDVDVVMVMTPSGLHAEIGCEAARAGKHVIVTKPMDVTLAACDRLIAACEEAGVRLAVDLEGRYHPKFRWVRAALQAGELGRPLLIEARCKWWRSAEYFRQSGGWRGTWRLDGGGVLANQAVHLLDLLIWTAGMPERVLAHVARTHHAIETEDVGLAILRFPQGAVGLINATSAHVANDEYGLEISGSAGSVSATRGRYDGPVEELVWRFGDGRPAPRTPVPQGPPHTVADVVAALQEGRPPAVDGHEGRKAVQLLAAIYASHRTGGWVEVASVTETRHPQLA